MVGVAQTDSNTRRVGISSTSPSSSCCSPVLTSHLLISVQSLVYDQLFTEGASILPLPATHVQSTRRTNSQNSRTRIKLSQIHDDIMSSPAGPSKIGGLGPRHRRPPAVEQRVPDEDYDEERERLTTNFNHPVSATFR